MKTNNTAASLHALCVAANEIVADLDEAIKSDTVRFLLQEDIDNCVERLENIDGYACDRINAGHPNALVVRLTRGCKELLREFFGKVEDIPGTHKGSEIAVALDRLCDEEARLERDIWRKNTYAGIELDLEDVRLEIDSAYDDLKMLKCIVDSYLTLALA